MKNKLTQVAFVYLKRDNKVLLLQENGRFIRGLWSFPGGHLEPGESFTEGAIRETLEESGYQIKIIKEIYHDIMPRIEYSGNPADGLVEIAIFQGEIIGGQMQIDNEALDLKWFDKKSALALPHRFKFLKELIQNS
ncbi:MAG TPA: NUDIX domain-containing protein [Candidatus Saccharimonadales bacterium]|nr:NUDIX domain-containing protein [Candidatus Saccharimonadales bacterium]